MALSTIGKNIAVSTGMYRPARRLSRKIHSQEGRKYSESVDLFRSLLSPEDICFDIGANIGEKSEALLEIGSQVIAFEPNPLVIPELLARCAFHKNFRLMAVAMGSRPTISTLHARKLSGQSSLNADWEGTKIGSFDVPVLTLDLAIEFFGVPNYCKIDVEGWELEVLSGLTQPIPLISFEFHLSDDNIIKTIACLERLKQFGSSDINITPAESSSFLYGNWIPIEKFLTSFPGNLKELLPGGHYGDIFVKNNAVTSPKNGGNIIRI